MLDVTPTKTCECLSDDPAVARQDITRAAAIARLVDEPHFGVSMCRCERCGQTFLRVFCEVVDWADSDDPQALVCIPIDEPEVRALRSLGIAPEEAQLLHIIRTRRRFLCDKHPKGAPRTLYWAEGSPCFPPHD